MTTDQSCEHGVPLHAVPRCTQCQDYFDPLNRDDVVAECKRLRAAWAGIFGERDRDNAAQWVADLLRNQRPAGETSGEWEKEARLTLDKLAAFLQCKNVPYAVNWRDWIDNAIRVLDAYSPEKTGDDGLCWIKGCQRLRGHEGFCDPLPAPDVKAGQL